MNTETKTIDVLAVMFAASVKMSGAEDDDLMKARVAVAELIEAAKLADAALMAWRSSGSPDLGDLMVASDKLSSALAAVGGAA